MSEHAEHIRQLLRVIAEAGYRIYDIEVSAPTPVLKVHDTAITAERGGPTIVAALRIVDAGGDQFRVTVYRIDAAPRVGVDHVRDGMLAGDDAAHAVRTILQIRLAELAGML